MAVVTYANLIVQADGVYNAATTAIQNILDSEQVNAEVEELLIATKAAIVAGKAITDASTES